MIGNTLEIRKVVRSVVDCYGSWTNPSQLPGHRNLCFHIGFDINGQAVVQQALKDAGFTNEVNGNPQYLRILATFNS